MIFFKCFLIACAVIGGLIGIMSFKEWFESDAPEWFKDLFAFLIVAFILACLFYSIYLVWRA